MDPALIPTKNLSLELYTDVPCTMYHQAIYLVYQTTDDYDVYHLL